MIRIRLLLIGLLALANVAFSQTPQSADDKTPKPVKWTVSYNVKEAKVGEEVELIIKGSIAPHQHMYANDYVCDPTAYTLIFTPNSSFKTIGIPKSFGFRKYVDDIFGCEVKDFEDKAEIHQKIRVLSDKFSLAVLIDYQTCTESMCLAFKDKLQIPSLKVLPGEAIKDTAQTIVEPIIMDSSSSSTTPEKMTEPAVKPEPEKKDDL